MFRSILGVRRSAAKKQTCGISTMKSTTYSAGHPRSIVAKGIGCQVGQFLWKTQSPNGKALFSMFLETATGV
jgi:hypothetical protein